MQRLRRGFDSRNVVTLGPAPASRYPVAEGPAVVERLLTSVEQLPVESAAVNRCTPFTGCSRTILFFSDRPNDPATAPVVGRHYVSGLLQDARHSAPGRPRARRDRPRRPARRHGDQREHRPALLAGENPIGKRVWFGGTTGPFAGAAQAVEIVGIVGDVRYEAADWPDATGRPEFYTSYCSSPTPTR